MSTPEQTIPAVVVDEKADKDDDPASAAANAKPESDRQDSYTKQPGSPGLLSPNSPPQSPPASPPIVERRRVSRTDDYYASAPQTDRFGNPLPARWKPRAMSTVFGTSTVRLPGDLGTNDPRRPRSPAPQVLPGDLGPNDPRKARSRSPAVGGGSRIRSASEASYAAPLEGERVLKDPKEPAPPPSDDEAGGASDSDEDADNDNETEREETKRGRHRKRPEPGRTTSGKSINLERDSDDSDQENSTKWRGGAKPDPTKGESKLSFQGETGAQPVKKRVHPSTAFDMAPPGIGGAFDSDHESHSEIRAAQKLSLAMSNIHSTPSAHRVIRQIIRGDYAHFQREAEQGRRRQRMYLVATDISPEAEYALEWTIGTVLRDGDTLFAVYAVGEENAGSGISEGGVEIGRGADMVKDTAAVLNRLQNKAIPAQSPGPSRLGRSAIATPADERSPSRGAAFSAAETERRRALEDVSARCVRLLRKTRLQVRVVVEVFHCKSPRHMITELIDFLSPTLVIIGSRGRSAVKGVLLGSFSNYLVTKSSVPVMVARKRLRKHSAAKRNRDGTIVPYSGSGRTGRFSNIIEAPKGKGLRVKGWDEVGID